MHEHSLNSSGIQAGYGRKVIVDRMSITVPHNKISVLIGANACGKSTFLKTIAGLIPPLKGEVLLGKDRIDHIPPRKLARTLGILPQSPLVPEGITVADLVSRGRFPHRSFLRSMTERDYEAVEEALGSMGISGIADRNVNELSGGQRQRVWIAMALAQETDILLLDEPTTFLDVTHQIEILELLKELNAKRGTTILMVLHDINMSIRYADFLFALKQGRLIAQGAPEEIVTEELIRDVFNLECRIIDDPVTGMPMIVPLGRAGYALSD